MYPMSSGGLSLVKRETLTDNQNLRKEVLIEIFITQYGTNEEDMDK